MRFIVDGYEIEIKARSTYKKTSRFSKNDTLSFLNQVSMWMDEAAKYKNFERRGDDCEWTEAERENSKACAGYLREASDELYHQLKEAGCYDNL